MTPEELNQAIAQAVHNLNEGELQTYAHYLRGILPHQGEFQEHYFKVLIYWLSNEQFLNIDSAYFFFTALLNCREFLPEALKEKLLPSMTTIFESFEENSFEQIQECINEAIAQKDESRLQTCCFMIDSSLISANHFLGEIFDFLIELYHNQSFWESEGAWHLISVLTTPNNWELLSEKQKEKVFIALTLNYTNFKYWMSHFIITEVLGEYFANDKTFQWLYELRQVENEQQRQFVPHGLEHLVRDSGNQELVRKAYAQLLEMNNDPSERVRGEVDESLAKIKRLCPEWPL